MTRLLFLNETPINRLASSEQNWCIINWRHICVPEDKSRRSPLFYKPLLLGSPFLSPTVSQLPSRGNWWEAECRRSIVLVEDQGMQHLVEIGHIDLRTRCIAAGSFLVCHFCGYGPLLSGSWHSDINGKVFFEKKKSISRRNYWALSPLAAWAWTWRGSSAVLDSNCPSWWYIDGASNEFIQKKSISTKRKHEVVDKILKEWGKRLSTESVSHESFFLSLFLPWFSLLP